MPRTILTTLFVLFAVAWSLLTFRAPITVGWRDSGEFIITSFFLDIPHSAGFPLYSQLSNLLSLIIPGPIAWRTHMFSLIITALILQQMVCLSRDLHWNLQKKVVVTQSPFVTPIIVVLTSSAVLTDTYWRSIETAEVYALHTLSLLITLRLLSYFSSTRDCRFLYCAALTGGLSLANHAVGALFGAWVFLGILLFRKASFKVLATSMIFGLMGLSTYAYLPIRSSAEPPLNTGAPTTISRLLLHLSNTRDRDLRPPVQTVPSTTSVSTTILEEIANDLSRFITDISSPLALMALCGLTLLLRRAPFEAYCLIGVPITTLGFFKGWDIDPWIPATSTALILAATFGAHALVWIQHKASHRVAACSTAALLLVVGMIALPVTTKRLKELPPDSALQSAEDTLSTVANYGTFISEATWFITRYAQVIEGIAPHATTVYLPSVLFPHYFNPAKISTATSQWTAIEQTNPREPAFQNLFTLIDLASQAAPLQIDPSGVATSPLREIIQLDKSGTLQIKRGESGGVDPEFIHAFAQKLSSINHRSLGCSAEVISDVDEHIKILLAQLYVSLSEIAPNSARAYLCNTGEFSFITPEKLSKSARILVQICS